jgi:hypothetical protein
MSELIMTEQQRQLSESRKQIPTKSSMMILREQVANIEMTVNNVANQLRLLTDAVNASNSVQAHRDDQVMIQAQLELIRTLQKEIAEWTTFENGEAHHGDGA